MNSKKNGTSVDVKLLEKSLSCEVSLINAQNKFDVKNSILNSKFYNNFIPTYLNKFPILEIKNLILPYLKNSNLDSFFLATKCLEEDENIFNLLKLPQSLIEKIKKYNLKVEIINSRYDFINCLIKKCLTQKKNFVYGQSKLDKIFLNKFLAFPIFILIMLSIFYLTFSSIGELIKNSLEFCLNSLIISPAMTLIKSITQVDFIISFFENGIFTVLSTLISFLPQIVLLFLFLSILEDTGYMSRLAFVFEDIFSLVGLNGKIVFTLLMGFGCSATAALTSRTLEDKNSKIKATMLSSYMSCSAKIPLYSVICAGFFTNSLLIIAFLYFLGVFIALIVSTILEKTILKSENVSFIMEFPAYRFPNFKRILKVIWSNIKDFVVRVGSVLFTFSVIIWMLQSYTFSLKFITNPQTQKSIMQTICEILAPIFKPLGFGNYGAVACLICGLVAKEIIVSTMCIINNISLDNSSALSKSLLNENSVIHFTPISAFSFMIFSLLYAPCVATIGVYFKEIGKKWTYIAILIQFVVAYAVTFVFYQIMCLFSGFNFLSIFLSLLIITCVVFSFYYLIKIIKKPKVCCFNCKYCNEKCKK